MQLVRRYRELLEKISQWENYPIDGSIVFLNDHCRQISAEVEITPMMKEMIMSSMLKQKISLENALKNIDVDIDEPFEDESQYGKTLMEIVDKKIDTGT